MSFGTENDHCPTIVCSLLPLGYIFLASDLYRDLRWCIWPSHTTANDLKNYYITILTPKLALANPGYLFPVYVTFKFCYECPDFYNFLLLLCYIPLCYRYYGILSRRDKTLPHWWTVVLIRFVMLWVVHKGLQSRGCQLSNLPATARDFAEIALRL
eukprot:CAMPEP_0194049982 /NCGR_PEP_ID=MMETSP0009_2-20130614/32324_1 /TAXON_ID=210454 /ORGANISM="Grammatophora oceanica, Strain CCMP 410" /LENGTH=155 /DNA_ID=CAMNT_0038696329 /DNA_START=132 /DNA_END=599 /DNA_ORIENTATION=+